MTGTIEEIYIAQSKRDAVQPVSSAILEAGRGIVGDREQIGLERLPKDSPIGRCSDDRRCWTRKRASF